MPTGAVELTIVVPFYNAGPRLVGNVAEIVSTLDQTGLEFEVLAVSDGSTDGSEAALANLADSRVKLIVLPEHEGKGQALNAGLTAGRGRYLGFIDADGDLPAALLPSFVTEIRSERVDIVVGSKRHPASDVVYPPLRRMYSWGFQQLVRLLFDLRVRDTQTGIKVVRREVLEAVLPQMLEKRFAFDLELLVLAQRRGYRRISELPVRIGERFVSTISVKAVLRTLADTMVIWWRLRFTHAYKQTS